MLKFTRFTPLLSRRFLTTPSDNVLEALSNRTLIRVSGPEVSTFLQGLITNDIEHLKSGPGSMYAMFLNNSGRILYDTIIYRPSEENTYLIECDKQITNNLQKHLKLYRVRRKIDIASVDDELKIFVLFNTKINVPKMPATCKTESDLVFRDPRIASLGTRIIAKPDSKVTQNINLNNSERSYRRLRYTLGVGEGIEDLPPGDCFPLECNCDYLHGVSFHKGCYIGQELTARIHHTGMVRKRLMPLHFHKAPSKLPEEKIMHDNVNLGKLRGVEGDAGLALLRIAKALPLKEIKIGDGSGYTSKPDWWPVEAPKEKISRLQ